ncbi:hypothetical protein [Muricoccus radiodurans]|uniref:hypothetical protein n=1 Tax=Muricoccus radiodurans TaxID=2231721 RepID=UPI003CE76ADA
MSRKFAALGAVLAFCAFTAIAHAQSGEGDGSARPPGSRGAAAAMGGGPLGTTTGTPGAASLDSGRSTDRTAQAMTGRRGRMMRSSGRTMRQQAAMRRQMAMRRGGATRAAAGSDAAYQGGGAVYDRLPDGSLRPAN